MENSVRIVSSMGTTIPNLMVAPCNTCVAVLVIKDSVCIKCDRPVCNNCNKGAFGCRLCKTCMDDCKLSDCESCHYIRETPLTTCIGCDRKVCKNCKTEGIQRPLCYDCKNKGKQIKAESRCQHCEKHITIITCSLCKKKVCDLCRASNICKECEKELVSSVVEPTKAKPNEETEEEETNELRGIKRGIDELKNIPEIMASLLERRDDAISSLDKSVGNLMKLILEGYTKNRDSIARLEERINSNTNNVAFEKMLKRIETIEENQETMLNAIRTLPVKKTEISTYLCKVCAEREVCIRLYPCQHVGLCKECAGTVEKCPFCKKEIEFRCTVYLP